MWTLKERAARRQALQDARSKINQVDAFVVAALGTRPTSEAASDLRYASAMTTMHREQEARERQSDLQTLRQEATGVQSRFWLILGIGLLWAVEFVAASEVLRSAGFTPPGRAILAVMLSASLIAAAYFAIGAMRRSPENREPRAMTGWLVLGGLVLIALAIAVLRIEEASVDPSGTRATDWATAILVLALSLGPALLAERLLRGLLEGQAMRQQLAMQAAEVKGIEQSIEKARRYLEQVIAKQQVYDEKAAVLRSIYELHWSQEQARRELHGDEPRTGTSVLGFKVR
jgi:hypothetical protein